MMGGDVFDGTDLGVGVDEAADNRIRVNFAT